MTSIVHVFGRVFFNEGVFLFAGVIVVAGNGFPHNDVAGGIADSIFLSGIVGVEEGLAVG